MNEELKNLEDGGWRDMSEFVLFRRAMEGIAEGDDGTTYFGRFASATGCRSRVTSSRIGSTRTRSTTVSADPLLSQSRSRGG